ncbi:RNase P modulator RnpM [Mycoplasma capricolum]|uniref:RNase P modulator RnpM n=1 Tax=Mycoplasma capricolum TaxID=2095 RepID=UPI003DA6C405
MIMTNTMINKNKNLRKDIASNQMLEKHQLIRIVKNKNDEIFIDNTYKANGRGVYLKPDLNSLKIAREKNLIAKSLKSKIDVSIYDQLEEFINAKR